MFAWLLIAFELAFLYFAYWYVFVREPKHYRVDGETWGGYDTSSNELFEKDVLDFQRSVTANIKGSDSNTGDRAA